MIEKSGDQEAYNLHLQNYPLTIEEAFLNAKGSRFDIGLLNSQRSSIYSSKYLEYQIQRGNLHWELTVEGRETVRWEPTPLGPYKVLSHPKTEYTGLDIGGIDSYDQDEAGSSDSLGSAMI